MGSGGFRLLANPGQSIVSGSLPIARWTPRESNRYWFSIASSADGTKLVAVVFRGQIYTSSPSAQAAGTTTDMEGAYASHVQLTYAGSDTFLVTDALGDVIAF